MLERYDNFDEHLPACDVEGQRQWFIWRLSSCCQDLEAVKDRMCQLAASQEASQAVSDVTSQNFQSGDGPPAPHRGRPGGDMQDGNDNVDNDVGVR